MDCNAHHFFCIRLHYVTSTNCGHCQSNMTWCYEVRGSTYHWVIDLYDRSELPVIPVIVEALKKEVADCMKEIQRGKMDQKKKQTANPSKVGWS